LCKTGKLVKAKFTEDDAESPPAGTAGAAPAAPEVFRRRYNLEQLHKFEDFLRKARQHLLQDGGPDTVHDFHHRDLIREMAQGIVTLATNETVRFRGDHGAEAPQILSAAQNLLNLMKGLPEQAPKQEAQHEQKETTVVDQRLRRNQ
jgi:hypothetical protein